MAGRSHRHRVPTTRGPARALGVVYLWGCGKPGAALHAYLHASDAHVDDRDDIARALAGDHGCLIGQLREAWAWRLDGVDPAQIDRITRGDPAVMGWTANAREVCPPSLALRNALNAAAPDELSAITGTVEQRFAKPGRARTPGEPRRWIARDDRIVFFDEDRNEWRVGEYAGS